MDLIKFTISLVVVFVGLQSAISDFRFYKIPNKHNLLVAILFSIEAVRHAPASFLVIYIFVVFAHLFISLVIPNQFGMGDSKMISAYGLGFTTVESMFIWLYLAYFLGSLHGIWLKLSAKPTRIPFGMSIYAAWLAIYMGEYAHVAMDYSR